MGQIIKEGITFDEMYYDGNKCFRIEPDERLFKAIKDVAPFKVYTD